MPKEHKLTAVSVRNLTKCGLHGDGLGLYLQISASGTKSWLFRFQLNGVARKMGLGPAHTVSLAHARQLGAEARLLLLEGRDPIEARLIARSTKRMEAANAFTFRECAETFIAGNEAGWKNVKHREQWRSTLSKYAYPVIGSLPVSSIDTRLVLKAIEPIWSTKPETASRLRGRLESVLDWATVKEYRSGDNPARWRGHLDKVLVRRSLARSIKHHNAVPFAELPSFMAELATKPGISARALEVTILTAVRTSEAIFAEWREIDLEARVWTIPGKRMKAGKEHRVPLSSRVAEIFSSSPRDGGVYVFMGSRIGRPISNMAMLELLRGMRGFGSTVHGFRSSFRDWAAESTNYPNHIVEMALAHAIGNKVEAAYRRGDLFIKRESLMSDWASFCQGRQSGFNSDRNVE